MQRKQQRPRSTVGFELEQLRPYIRAQEEAHGSGGRFQIQLTKTRFRAAFR